ncbi:hypothetical protein VPH35_044690 [Triticum aestivum]
MHNIICPCALPHAISIFSFYACTCLKSRPRVLLFNMLAMHACNMCCTSILVEDSLYTFHMPFPTSLEAYMSTCYITIFIYLLIWNNFWVYEDVPSQTELIRQPKLVAQSDLISNRL